MRPPYAAFERDYLLFLAQLDLESSDKEKSNQRFMYQPWVTLKDERYVPPHWGHIPLRRFGRPNPNDPRTIVRIWATIDPLLAAPEQPS